MCLRGIAIETGETAHLDARFALFRGDSSRELLQLERFSPLRELRVSPRGANCALLVSHVGVFVCICANLFSTYPRRESCTVHEVSVTMAGAVRSALSFCIRHVHGGSRAQCLKCLYLTCPWRGPCGVHAVGVTMAGAVRMA
jgi:hypothetical protein